MERVIPEGAFLVKEGLYVHERSFLFDGKEHVVWDLYSAEGWCFYDLKQAENYVDGVVGGELVPEGERAYSRFAIMPKDSAYVSKNIVSVPIPEITETPTETRRRVTR